jgi:hypothetical protein
MKITFKLTVKVTDNETDLKAEAEAQPELINVQNTVITAPLTVVVR